MTAMGQGSYGMEPVATIVPGQGFLLLAGERRLAARARLGDHGVTLYVVSTWQEFMAWMLLDEEHTAKLRKTTESFREAAQVGNRDGAIERKHDLVSAARFMNRAMDHLETTRKDAPQRTIAEYLDLPVRAIRETKYLFNWLNDPRPEVVKYAEQELFNVANWSINPHSAHDRVRRYANTLSGMSVQQQRRILEGASSQVVGIADALRPLGTLSPDLTDEEIDNAIRHLSAGRLAVERVIRALKALKENRQS